MTTYYFCDDQTGSVPGVVPGDDTRSTTDAQNPLTPWRTMTGMYSKGIYLNNLGTGDRLLFAQGGAWTSTPMNGSSGNIALANTFATRTQPLYFGSYAPTTFDGQGQRPTLRIASRHFIEFGPFGTTSWHGGYHFDGLKVVGTAGVYPTSYNFLLPRRFVQDITVTNCDISGFDYFLNFGDKDARRITIRRNEIHDLDDMGFLGSCSDYLIEFNNFYNINPTGSTGNHAIYLGNSVSSGENPKRRLRVRFNTLTNISSVGGVGEGGQMTFHGQLDGLVIEGNVITQVASNGGVYGISVTRGYTTPEFFRRTHIRGNVLKNMGSHYLAISGAPNIVVENNVLVMDNTQGGVVIAIPVNAGGDPSYGGDLDTGAKIRNNTIYMSQPSAGIIGLSLRTGGGGAGSNLEVANNIFYLDSTNGTTYGMQLQLSAANFTAIRNNDFHECNWSTSNATVAAGEAAYPGVSGGNLATNPQFVTAPTSANNWSVLTSAGSTMRDGGSTTYGARLAYQGYNRSTPPDIGAADGDNV